MPTDTAIAPEVHEPAAGDAMPAETGASAKNGSDGDLEYEVEFATPFGKLEFEFEPIARKKKKDEERRAQAEQRAARKAAEAAKKIQARAAKRGRGLLGNLLIILLVMAVIGALVAVAYWLFARPGDEDEAIPAEFSKGEPEPAPQGFAAKARKRIGEAVRAGRRASRQAQREQERKYREYAGER